MNDMTALSINELVVVIVDADHVMSSYRHRRGFGDLRCSHQRPLVELQETLQIRMSQTGLCRGYLHKPQRDVTLHMGYVRYTMILAFSSERHTRSDIIIALSGCSLFAISRKASCSRCSHKIHYSADAAITPSACGPTQLCRSSRTSLFILSMKTTRQHIVLFRRVFSLKPSMRALKSRYIKSIFNLHPSAAGGSQSSLKKRSLRQRKLT